MHRLSICRICLTANIDYKIADTQLQEMYEKLNAVPFQTSDMRPLTLCYICQGQLNSARRLMLKCLKAEELLTVMLNQLSMGEDKESKVTLIDQTVLKQLCFTEIQQISISNTDDNIDMDIKEEIQMYTKDNIKFEDESVQDFQGTTNSDNELDNARSPSEPDEDEPLNYTRNVKKEGAEKRVNISKKRTARGKQQKRKTVTKKKQNGRATHDEGNSTNDMEYIIEDSDSQSRSDTAGDKFFCGICRKSYMTKYALLNHRLTHMEGRKLFFCDVCNKGFTMKHNLARHTITHTGERPYVCNICNKGFNQSGSLKIHMLKHTDVRPYECTTCGKSFKMKQKLSNHENLHISGVNVHPYICDICGKGFTQKFSLITHTRMHTGERPYVCDVCHKGFVRKVHLDIHMRIHTGENPYQCTVCNKSFSQHHTLLIHSIVHTGEKPYKCGLCEKAFNFKGNLKRHELIHTGERPYACEFCGKCFNQKNALTVHTRMHTGEKPFVCFLCDKRFTEQRALSKHQLANGHI